MWVFLLQMGFSVHGSCSSLAVDTLGESPFCTVFVSSGSIRDTIVYHLRPTTVPSMLVCPRYWSSFLPVGSFLKHLLSLKVWIHRWRCRCTLHFVEGFAWLHAFDNEQYTVQIFVRPCLSPYFLLSTIVSL